MSKNTKAVLQIVFVALGICALFFLAAPFIGILFDKWGFVVEKWMR